MSYFCVTCPLSQPHTPFLSTPEFLVCCPPSGILTWHSSTCQGSIFSLVSFGSFLSSVRSLEEKWARHPSLPLKSSFPYLVFTYGPHISVCTWSRPCYWPPAWAAVFHSCVTQAHWPKLHCSSPLLSMMWLHWAIFHSPYSIKSCPLGKPSMVLLPPVLCAPCCPSNDVLNTQCSGR